MTQSVHALDALLDEHADLERQLADPELHSDPARARKVGRRFAQLAPIVATFRKLQAVLGEHTVQLLDTYDSLAGARHAADLRRHGTRPRRTAGSHVECREEPRDDGDHGRCPQAALVGVEREADRNHAEYQGEQDDRSQCEFDDRASRLNAYGAPNARTD